MKVSEFIKLLEQFPDQDADVLVVEHHSGRSPYDQGGTVETVILEPELHLDYTDFRGNPFVKPDTEYFNQRTLLIGVTNL